MRFLWGLIVLVSAGPTFALDPRVPGYEFKYTLYPPNFNPKRGHAVLRFDPKKPKASPIIKDGKFTDFAQWYYAIGSDPQNFAKWWYGYFEDPKVWQPGKTPVYEGNSANNQGHRIIAWLHNFHRLIETDPEIDADVKKALMNDAWKRAVEKIIITTIGSDGIFAWKGNQANLACVFHFVRTKFGSLGLKFDNIYDVQRSQDLLATLLTNPSIISAEDRYLDPPSRDYLEKIGTQYAGAEADVRIVKGGKILYTGGLFIGWRNHPSLHGTWDGLAIINCLFKYHPDPNPASPQSIFYKWNKLPEFQRKIGTDCIVLMSRRLWLDWQETKGPTWCWVKNGKPTDDASKPSEAPFRPAYDGYNENQFGWAKVCWEEMFGNPQRNTNDGVQALLAIAHGKVHRNLKKPLGQQVPHRYDFDPLIIQQRLDDDIRFATPKTRPNGEKYEDK